MFGVLRRIAQAACFCALFRASSGHPFAQNSTHGPALDASQAFHWQASWIGVPTPATELRSQVGGTSAPGTANLPLFRYEFHLSRRVVAATLRISGLGQFEAHLNGRKVTGDLLTPGWTNYRKCIFFDTYQVTSSLHTGVNVLGVMLGNGMYDVEDAPGRYSKFSGTFGPLKLIAQLDITFADGSSQTVVSDQRWKTSPGPITFSSIYGGEDYDARIDQSGWDRPGFRDRQWTAAATVDGPGGALVPETIPPVRAFESYVSRRISHPQPGITVYDLGQNFSGWPEIAVSGPRGASLKLLCGELLDDHGRVTQKSANAFPDSEDAFHYVLKGQGLERWSPRFSYTGFRYVEVNSTNGQPVKISQLRGRAIRDDAITDGQFSSSNPLFNRIHRLIDQAIRSNMVSVLTDCPHREKLGWLEQTHLAAPSLLYNYDLASLYNKMADDMQDAQLPNGLVPDIAPEFAVFPGPFRDSPEWGAAVVLGPWAAYQFYGDVEPLRRHYDSMKSYAGYLHGRLQGGLLLYGLGDWYDIGPGDPGESKLTSRGLTATATYFELLTALRRIALLVDRPEDAEGFALQAEAVRAAFNAAYFHPGTREYDRGSQTANAMPLVVGLVPEADRSAVLANLVHDIRLHTNHVTAGDIGFHYVIRALTDGDRSDVVYDMLSRTDRPSYGDQLAHGATTLTEAWDANPNSSQNHFMLGHAEEWFYRGLAGIDFDMSRNEADRLRIQPNLVGDVRGARASFTSRLGRIESEWRLQVEHPGRTDNKTLEMRVALPAGTQSTVVIPGDQEDLIQINGHPLRLGGPVRSILADAGKTVCVLDGGNYVFRLPFERKPLRGSVVSAYKSTLNLRSSIH